MIEHRVFVKEVENRMGMRLLQHDGRLYVRFVGGLALPGLHPGYSVLIGEEATHRKPFPCKVLWEFESNDPYQLIEKVSIEEQKYQATFYGDRERAAPFIRHHNEVARREERESFSIAEAPFLEEGNLSSHLHALNAALAPGNKYLFFGPESDLTERLMQVSTHEVHKLKARDNPAVAALGYAFSIIALYQSNEPRPAEMAITEYDTQRYS